MAEVWLVKFAAVALCVGQAALPAYRSKFSKRQFTQPPLLAILCLMRYEDWTFREAEVRLAEPHELRAVLGLQHVPIPDVKLGIAQSGKEPTIYPISTHLKPGRGWLLVTLTTIGLSAVVASAQNIHMQGYMRFVTANCKPVSLA